MNLIPPIGGMSFLAEDTRSGGRPGARHGRTACASSADAGQARRKRPRYSLKRKPRDTAKSRRVRGRSSRRKAPFGQWPNRAVQPTKTRGPAEQRWQSLDSRAPYLPPSTIARIVCRRIDGHTLSAASHWVKASWRPADPPRGFVSINHSKAHFRVTRQRFEAVRRKAWIGADLHGTLAPPAVGIHKINGGRQVRDSEGSAHQSCAILPRESRFLLDP